MSFISNVLKSNSVYYTAKSTELLIRQSKANTSQKSLEFISNEKNVENIVSKSRVVGYEVYEDTSNSGNTIYSIHTNNKIKIISDKQIKIANGNSCFTRVDLASISFDNVDTKELIKMTMMFYQCRIRHMDLTKLNLRKIKIASFAFSELRADTIDFGENIFEKLEDAGNMFENIYVSKSMHMPRNMFSKVKNMDFAFNSAMIPEVALSLNKAITMHKTFYSAQIKELQLTNLNSLEDLEGTFINCLITTIILDGNTKNLQTAHAAFYSSIIENLVINNIDFSNSNNTDIADRSRIVKFKTFNVKGLVM